MYGSSGRADALLHWMLGYRDHETTLIYADDTQNPHEAERVEAAFAVPTVERAAHSVALDRA